MRPCPSNDCLNRYWICWINLVFFHWNTTTNNNINSSSYNSNSNNNDKEYVNDSKLNNNYIGNNGNDKSFSKDNTD